MATVGRPWPLRHRLLAALLGLSAAALTVFAGAGVLLLERSLISRVDTQLYEISATFRAGRPPPPAPRPREGSVELPTQFRVAFYDPSGTLLRDVPPGSADGPAIPAEAIAMVPARPVTVPARTEAADWRTLVVRSPNGDRVAVSMSLEATQSTVRQLLLIEVATGALILVLLGVVALAVVRLGLRPLTRMEQTATAIAAGDLDRRVPDSDPRTETGRLGHALNVMLERLGDALRRREDSELRLRRFLADASHELRTPLTSIRGFAELYRHGRGERDPAVARILGRVEGAAERMGVLVDDLMLLARLDQERALDLSDVDLRVIAGDVVHDARIPEPDREIELAPADGPVRVVGDEHRLHQVVANLVANALAHTPPGTAVRVTVGHLTAPGPPEPGVTSAGTLIAPAGRAAFVEVRDDGPGIEPEHLPHVFDRFYRAEAGRSRESGGTGLGLAIAAALVEAHEGRVEARSEPGRGTAFRVILPVAGPTAG
ncbi:sensor histidine kinase [Nonomuraea cavernae]|uniref:sensor histidine kinase n=1 Tax=Nonomuraea cavernae TaxID=2045107 RepID=UPI0016643877|nr:HAMP domain-containing sensor histidine kinase [Nonomuraea cavernae]MCA2183760.1 HAMP domain-containing histidine kinase [Nonomuraea cavernae]